MLDIRQINEDVNNRPRTKVREYVGILRKKIWGKYFFEKTCFCHREAARRILGDDWFRWAEVVPVGVDKGFIELPLIGNKRGEK